MNRNSVVRFRISTPALFSAFLIILCSITMISLLVIDANARIQKAHILREYKGINLAMTRDEVIKKLGNPNTADPDQDEWKMLGEDVMIIRYEESKVRAIQLAFFDSKNAPIMKDVVGDAEISILDNGAKHARKVLNDENFWVSYWQSKDETMTRITIQKSKP